MKLGEKMYKIALKAIEEHFEIPDTTYMSQLDKIGKRLFGDKYVGTYPSDKVPTLQQNQYCIANLDSSGGNGSHWIALCKDDKNIQLVYDSFGRETKKIIKLKDKNKQSERDAEQDILENNCGARSLAFIYVFDRFGRERAREI